MPGNDSRLIEDYLPIRYLSAEGAREKSVRKGHPSAVHLWWARRPLVAARAAVYAAMVELSRFSPESKNGASLARANAARFIERLCKYPGVPDVVKQAETHVLEAHAARLTSSGEEDVTVKGITSGEWPRPRVADMFAGGGAIPLEVLRLGCDAFALDLNPVAHIVQLCTLVYPEKFGAPDSRAAGTGPNGTWGGLVDEVRHWGGWVLDKVRSEIGSLYPSVELYSSSPFPKQGDLGLPGQAVQSELGLSDLSTGLTPVAYLWTRTVKCNNPSCGAVVPLVRHTWVCKKTGRYVALKPTTSGSKQRVGFQVVEASTPEGLGFDPDEGSKRGNASCFFCGTVATSDLVKREGKQGRLAAQLMAVACTRRCSKGKIYISADDLPGQVITDSEINLRIEELCERSGLSVPNEPFPVHDTRAFAPGLYGFSTWGDLFTPRQKLCLLSFAAAIKDAEKAMEAVEPERRKAVVTILGAVLDRLSDFNSSFCTFNYTGGRGVKNTFGRSALPMVWDFAETNPFNPDAASWISGIEDVPAALEGEYPSRSATVERGSATQLPWEDESMDAVVTDPPYYDNVPYAHISDYFYVWLKRTVGHLYPEHFASELTPKKSEAVADVTRHGGDKETARAGYEALMAESFKEAHRVLKPGAPIVIVYAHKTTLGWGTLINALRTAGFTVTEAWPLDTEKPGRLRAQNSAALASSIFLVGRKRDSQSVGSYENEVQPELEQIVRERVETLWKMGITGADLVIAAVGAGLRAYTRFERVEYANGEEVPVSQFLGEVEGLVLDTVLEKIFRLPRAGVATVDGPSRFYVLWRYAYGAAPLESGEAIVFTYGQPVELDGPDGLSTGANSLVEKKSGKYSLRDFSVRGKHAKLGLTETEGAQAPLVDVLHRALWLLENDQRHLAEFLDEAKPDAERLRLLAQALGGPGLKGGAGEQPLVVTTASEQSSLSKLLANWRSLIDERLMTGKHTLFAAVSTDAANEG